MYLRDTISISKINAAFLTGQQINRIHVQQLLFTMFVCKPHNTQRLLLYHEPSNSSIDPYAKKEPDFSWDVTIDILKSVPPGRAACIEKCRSKGFGALPNKHFATQKVFLYRRKHCLQQQCVLSVRIQPILALVKHESYQEENHSNTNEPRDDFLLMELPEFKRSYRE